MATRNSWNNQITAANVTFTGGTMDIGTDATDNAISIGTAASAGRTITIGNATGTSSVAVNCGTGGATFGTSANAHSTTIGSTSGASATTVQSGSGALNVTATAGVLTINSGTGALSISNDASATTVNIATGAAAKTVTLGSTNTTSSLALKYGTSDFSLASATGNVMVALDTGEITEPLQPAFSATKDATQTDVTGNNTVVTVSYTSEIFDQNADYDTGTSTFTAPVTGRYVFWANIYINQLSAAATLVETRIVTSNRNYWTCRIDTAAYPFTNQTTEGCIFADMDAADTAYVSARVNGMGADTVDLTANLLLYFGGFLCC